MMGNVSSDLWPYGQIPYIIDNRDFSATGKKTLIQSAIDDWERDTVLRFIPKEGHHEDYIIFHEADQECSSGVGRCGGKQEVLCDLDGGDFDKMSIMHEIGHAVGLHHEHERPDRDTFITVNKANIDPNFPSVNFNKCGTEFGPYDFMSRMHYTSTVGAMPGLSTIVPKNGETLSNRTGLSALDKRTIAAIYGNVEGNLLWYKHQGLLDGANSWGLDVAGKTGTGNVGLKIGSGWGQFRSVPMAKNGIIYAIKHNGDLLWYKHYGWTTGAISFSANGEYGIPGVDYGLRIGSGWQRFRSVFATNNGVIYAIEQNGDLVWYRHTGFANGNATWANATAKRIGTGWQRFQRVFSGNNGVIYAIEQNGDLVWYRHTGFATGDATWANPTARKIGSGWQRFRTVVASNRGVLYAIEQNGDLVWYRHNGFMDGSVNWGQTTAVKIGSGWQIFQSISCTNDGILYGVVG